MKDRDPTEIVYALWVKELIRQGVHKELGRIMFEAHDTHGLSIKTIIDEAAKVEKLFWQRFAEKWNKEAERLRRIEESYGKGAVTNELKRMMKDERAGF